MDIWTAVEFFLLGGGAGALTTAALYSRQFRELKRLIGAASRNRLQDEQSPKPEGVRRKSA